VGERGGGFDRVREGVRRGMEVEVEVEGKGALRLWWAGGGDMFDRFDFGFGFFGVGVNRALSVRCYGLKGAIPFSVCFCKKFTRRLSMRVCTCNCNIHRV
jgi:hypothetical protein